MIHYSKEDFDIILETKGMIQGIMSELKGNSRETAKKYIAFCMSLEERDAIAKKKHSEVMRKYRSDPKTKERAAEIDRKAMERFRERQKAKAKEKE